MNEWPRMSFEHPITAAIVNRLRDQPRGVWMSITARTGLRVLPLIVNARPADAVEFGTTLAIPCFRSAAVAWATARWPHRIQLLRPASAVAAGHAGDAERSIPGAVLRSEQYLATSARGALRTVREAARLAAARGWISTQAIDQAFSAAPVGGEEDLAAALWADIALIESGGTRDKSIALAQDLAELALWHQSTPAWVREPWKQLKDLLLTTNEDWEVWTHWYEDRLAGEDRITGRRLADEEVELARALIPDEIWRDGPSVVNTKIRDLIDGAHKIDELPDETALPQQSPRAAIFTLAEGGVIGLAPPTAQDRLTAVPEVQEFYEETRQQAQHLADLGVNMLGARLQRAVIRFQESAPASLAEAIERRVWSSGNALRVILNEHDAAGMDPTHPKRLEPSVAETLRGFVDTLNQLTFADPSLRQRDLRRPGPQEVSRTVAGLKIAVEIVPVPAASRAITNAEAGAELSEQIDAARDRIAAADDGGVPGKLAGEHAGATFGNFSSEAVLRVSRAARNHFRAGTSNLTSGFYRAAGATIFASALATTQQIRPEIVSWVIGNSQQLIALGETFFEHVPAFREIVEWLRARVVDDAKDQ